MLVCQKQEKRLSWARQNVSRGDSFLFQTEVSDNKRLNIDRPDCKKYYWNDLSTEIDRIFKKRRWVWCNVLGNKLDIRSVTISEN